MNEPNHHILADHHNEKNIDSLINEISSLRFHLKKKNDSIASQPGYI